MWISDTGWLDGGCCQIQFGGAGQAYCARVIGVLGLLSVGFLLFALLTSNPFDRLMPAAMDGADLNPLLQDPGLAIHPPLLYIGYVGFLGRFRLRDCSHDQRRSRPELGASGPGPGPWLPGPVPHDGHCARKLVGILRIGLGWLVVLGPC